MNVVEKIAYTKGFFSGLNIDKDTKEGKAFHALLDVLEELVVSNTDLEQQCAKLKSQVREMDEHVADVFNNVFDNASYELDNRHLHGTDMFEVVCPECGTRTTFGQSVALRGFMDCPGCGINLEFDYDDAPTKTISSIPQPAVEEPLLSSESKGVQDGSVVKAEQKEESVTVSFSESNLTGVTFATAPPLPKSDGEKDRIPQTADFVYSESTEDDDGMADMERQETEAPVSVSTMPGTARETTEKAPGIKKQAEREEPPETRTDNAADTETKTKALDGAAGEIEGKKAEVRSALVKVDFVADPEAFEAGKKKGAEYKFSTENVTLDFSEMIPDVPELPDTPET